MKNSKTAKLSLVLIITLVIMATITFSVSFSFKDKISFADGVPVTAEDTMQDFINKINTNNYVISCDKYLTTSVYSQNQIYFEYDAGLVYDEEHEKYDGVAFVTNQNETFMGYLGESNLEFISFVDNCNAIDTSYVQQRTLNYWFNAYLDDNNPNIWDYFANYDNTDVTKFVATDYANNLAVETMKNMTGLVDGGFGALVIEKVYLQLNYTANNLTGATLIGYDDDIDNGGKIVPDSEVTITFGNATADSRVNAWIANPEYPIAKTSWGEDLVHFRSLFLTDDPSVLPFPKYASYAFIVDSSNVIASDKLIARDKHATRNDFNVYIQQQLFPSGYIQSSENNFCYRKLLRAESKCYISVTFTVNSGITMEIEPWYEYDIYDNLTEVNQKIASCGYPEMNELTAGLSFVSAYDAVHKYAESWLNFFDFTTFLVVDIGFNTKVNIQNYLDEYTSNKLSDYEVINDSDDYDEDYDEVEAYLNESVTKLSKFKQVGDGNKYWQLETKEGIKTFRYYDNGNGTVTLLFKAQKYLSNDVIKDNLARYKFPAVVDGNGDDVIAQKSIAGRNLISYNMLLNDRGYPLDLQFSLNFASSQEARDFLDVYVENLEQNEFEIVIPDNVYIKKSYARYKSVNGKLWIVGFNISNNIVIMEFRVDELPKRIEIIEEYARVGLDIKDIVDEAADVGRALYLTVAGSNIVFDSTAVKAINSNAAVKFTMKVDKVTNGGDVRINVTLSLDGITFNSGSARVEIPFNEEVPEEKVARVYFIDSQGNKTDMEATFKDGKAIFTTNHFSNYQIVVEDIETQAARKNNLTTEQIIGIVVGVTIIVGIVGFLICWFAVRKKKAELAKRDE